MGPVGAFVTNPVKVSVGVLLVALFGGIALSGCADAESVESLVKALGSENDYARAAAVNALKRKRTEAEGPVAEALAACDTAAPEGRRRAIPYRPHPAYRSSRQVRPSRDAAPI